MFSMRQFFAPSKHDYLGSTMENLENSRSILLIYNLFGEQYNSQRRADVHVANDDLQISSQRVVTAQHKNTQ